MCEDKFREMPLTLDVAKVVEEGKGLKSFYFNHDLDAKPGQFVMLWLPGQGLKPFSISFQNKKQFGLTIAIAGEFTKKLMDIKTGDKLGVQGPYGTSYSIKEKNVALVGGGCGTASLGLLADELLKKGIKVHFIIGAKTKDALLFIERFKKKVDVIACTDDGSYGVEGFATSALAELLKKEKIGKVYTCGPEIMMAGVIDICDNHGIGCEVSMERYMKCGFGVCGQCCVDPLGIRICKEGPVLKKETAKKITEFSKYKRDASGKKIEAFPGCMR